MKKLKITRYQDGGHSWFKVARKELTKLGIEEKISSFSFQYGDYVYLEEDCDVAIFFKALLKIEEGLSWEKMTSVADITTKFSDKSSKIRNYPRFVPNFKPVVMEEGKKVRLYGKNYIIAGKTFDGKKWIIQDENGSKFRITKAQQNELFPCEE